MKRLFIHGVSLMVMVAALALPVQAAQDPPAALQVAKPADPGFLPRSLAGEDFADACYVMVKTIKTRTPTQRDFQAAIRQLPSAEEAAGRHFKPDWHSAPRC